MSEITRFRIARTPQRFIANPLAQVVVTETSQITGWLGMSDPKSAVAAYIEANGLNPPVSSFVPRPQELATFFTKIRLLDQYLASTGNRPKRNELIEAFFSGGGVFDTSPRGTIEQTEWGQIRGLISEALVAAVLVKVEPGLCADLTRLVLVFGLVELLAEQPKKLDAPEDIYWALSARTVLLPKELLTHSHLSSILARRAGFSDLYVVRDEWVKYEAGEIAYIENVLAGELKERKLVRTTETEEITTLEKETATLNERDSQTTDRFDLQGETTADTNLAAHIEGKVDTSGQYGPTHVDTHLGGSLDYSQEQSDRRAITQSKESVARAVTQVEEKVREVRTTRSLLRIEETNTHSIKNEKSMHMVGVYRWIDKIQRLQIFRYPHRYLLEFEIPEPAAWMRWMLDTNKDQGLFTKEPPALEWNGHDLTADDIDENNYLKIGAQYYAEGLNPPPGIQVVATNIEKDSLDNPNDDKEPIRFDKQTTVAVPTGWKANSWKAFVHSWHNPAFKHNVSASVHLSVGAGEKQVVKATSEGNDVDVFLPPPDPGHPDKVYEVGNITTGTIPVALVTDSAYGYSINILVTCIPLPETRKKWQIATYETIVQAYYALKRQHDEEVAARAVQADVSIDGNSPERNQQAIHEELKKLVIEMLTGTRFTGRPAIEVIDDKSPPMVDLIKAATVAPEIQFLEQAFEWENLTYVLYPYFWADSTRWKDLAGISSADPAFAQFLQAGSARVVVPAHPGFENQVQLYVEFGVLWGGGPVPAPNEPGYVSVAEEIKAQKQAPADGTPGESWEVRLPTTLVWLDNGQPLPTNQSTKLDPPPGKTLALPTVSTT